ncbi:MAG: protein kinase [Armatimonadota bacterium]|nr:MAG: protein kinase [Armatimonadota bacterium]
MPIVGQVLNDRYEVLEKIGEGGMAVAYRGRDRVLGRAVAIKVMRPELAGDAAFLARFRREARAAAGVTHEHIAGVYDSGSDGPYHYIVMEYVEGQSLKERLRQEGALPLAEALRIATAAAAGLEAAHEAGVIHRDIKPHNILLGREGQVKVTDFGIAGAASSVGQTDTSTIVGSVQYMSPEQARGEGVGPQGDLYSLGATLFEMLTGKPPFGGGDRLAILHKHIYDRPPRAGETRPGLPPEVDSVVAHCLEKDLSRRFASARELLSYLAACPRSEEAAAVPWAGRWRRQLAHALAGAGWWLRQRGVWLLAAAVLMAAVVTGLSLLASARGRATMVKVPDIEGMSTAAARELLGARKLLYREVLTKPSEDVAAGCVLSQVPSSGLEVAAETVVKVVLSTGPSHVVVPEVTRMSVTQAQWNLEAAGLAGGRVREVYHESVPKDYVAVTLPEAGTRVVRGTAVDMVVSLGPEPGLPVGPSLPTGPGSRQGREYPLDFTMPADGSDEGEREVVIEVVDEDGSRIIYRGRHGPGERIPQQTIRVVSATTARILVDGKVCAKRQYLP